MGSWSYISDDIVELILKKMDMAIDVLNFAAACKAWHSTSVLKYNRVPQNLPIYHFLPRACPLPMLLVPFSDSSNTRPYLYNIISKKSYNCFSASIFRNKWIPGSARGWLVTVDTKDDSINLLNPLTTKQISLPDFSSLVKPVNSYDGLGKYWDVKKAIVLFDASGKPENSVIVALVCQRICFCRVGDAKWKTMKHTPNSINDVINFKGTLYAVDYIGRLFVIEIENHTKCTLVAGQLQQLSLTHIPVFYIVESSSSDQILLVARTRSQEASIRIAVFGLVRSASDYEDWYLLHDDPSKHVYRTNVSFEWVELGSIGEQMIFLGYNHSLSLDSRAYPSSRGNCIYFADNLIVDDGCRFCYKWNHDHDVGVFHLQDKRVEPFAGLGRLPRHHVLWLSPNGW